MQQGLTEEMYSHVHEYADSGTTQSGNVSLLSLPNALPRNIRISMALSLLH